jgi:hypothetical protein
VVLDRPSIHQQFTISISRSGMMEDNGSVWAHPDFLRLLGTFDDETQRMIGPLEMQFGMRSIVVQAASVEAV